MTFVTQWFNVGADTPSHDKPGLYEVLFMWPGRPIMCIEWDGKKWARCGKLKPSHSWGDQWRGLYGAPSATTTRRDNLALQRRLRSTPHEFPNQTPADMERHNAKIRGGEAVHMD